jgi:hypothetical protein
MVDAPQIFLSCAADDDALGARVAAKLEARGCSVWRHAERSLSAAYRARTLAALESAEVVVVLWSVASIASWWVIDEADVGMKAGKAVEVEVGGVSAPLGFARAVRVRAAIRGGELTEREWIEIWEAVLEVAESKRPQTGSRQLGFDRSIKATVVNALVNLVVFGAMPLIAARFGEPKILLGQTGIYLSLCLALSAFASGYVGDGVAQAFGVPLRAHYKRLVWRWVAESVGAGIGASIFIIAHRAGDAGNSPTWLLDVVEIFLGVGSLISALFLGPKFISLLTSRHLRRNLLASRPLAD